ncbi:DUF1819 family protein [Mycolicibacterium sp. S3B2]|uniref:DUF1819 family protein n=1 Tax=Mycolicibacterium sp. S3B2 TaxID=3415120 RepID=UPI003C7E405A
MHPRSAPEEIPHRPAAAYRLSFTTGGLLRAEAMAVAEVLLTAGNETAARVELRARNLVQQRTATSTARVTREVVQRLSELPPDGVSLVAHGTVSDAGHIMWLAACLRYQFLRDFGSEVLRARFNSGQWTLSLQDFDTFWNLQSSWIDELRDAADTTRKKLRQNTFRMLREAGFLTDSGEIRQAVLSPEVAKVVERCSPMSFLSFPIDDIQVEIHTARKEAR